MTARPETYERLVSKIAIGQPDECWEWQGALSHGYGLLRADGRVVLAHRLAYEATRGPIAGHLDHLCRNPRCCNPAHLEDVTPRENILRGVGPAAINARKTHCPHGHEYTPANTYLRKGKHRLCRTCTLASQREKYRLAKVS